MTTTINLGQAPAWLESSAQGVLKECAGETLVGFFAQTEPVPGEINRVRPAYWVVVTDHGMYFFHPESQLCVRAKSIHPFEERA